MRALSASPASSAQRHHRNKLLRLVVPAIFLCLVFGVIFGVKSFLTKDRSASKRTAAKTEESGKYELPDNVSDTFDSLTGINGSDSSSNGESGNSEQTGAPEYLPVDGGIAALELLEKFLAMTTFEERLQHVESKMPEEELAASILGKPFPKVLNIGVDIRETNAMEQLVDYYYHVDFDDGSGGVNPQTMLVRTRGGGAPVVVVDPFIDLFGGRFAKYAETPTRDSGVFQVIISAGAFCYDDVPGAEKKFTLKILTREDTKEIAKAYFGKRSKIGDMLADETSGLAYGQAKACTVFMRWNTDEDPQNPFLEALDFKALNWNP